MSASERFTVVCKNGKGSSVTMHIEDTDGDAARVRVDADDFVGEWKTTESGEWGEGFSTGVLSALKALGYEVKSMQKED